MKKLFPLIFLLLLLLSGYWYSFQLDYTQPAVSFGVTFSAPYAEHLGLDWRQAYTAVLDELKVSHIRLAAYWNQTEPEQGVYDFSDLDWQIAEAQKRNVAVVLAVGRRLPRWPECHDPAWLSQLSTEQQQAALLNYLQRVVGRYLENPAIVRWQVENEPLLRWFGQCPPPDANLLSRELQTVRSLDDREILVTDSGELGPWVRAGKHADVLGTTLYRIVWNSQLGFWEYSFLPAAFYQWKSAIVRHFRPNLKTIIVSELQMEPWSTGGPLTSMTLEEQRRSFDLQRFWENILYAKRAGFSELYLWGVEYWYWLDQQGNPELWQAGKRLWSTGQVPATVGQ